MQIVKTKGRSARLHTTLFFSLILGIAALFAAIAGVGSNLDSDPPAAQTAVTSSARVAPAFGQANGGLTAGLPSPRDLRRHLRGRYSTSANAGEVPHHQFRSSL